ncbi:disulfide bond formation protein B [Roseobacter denitrificans]|uniref:disulfide bond formation protein B n=1 Tax=Roseobacter denitrificans TaxID=2434 RepID=UPI0005C76232|nr:disulfide bond formation protein B [Roseobacter denitrificans]AVL54750.1 disulfide bond formation protein B [Roseobacter denitrificans]SFF80289.1 Disulfide bond formation protein DsbB [Roseobacter denitrificans OCh 114]
MNGARLASLAAFGSAALLAGAFLFQALGYAPCQMCIWQRYPHGVAMAIGLIALAVHQKWLRLVGAAAALTTSAIGFYHAGVEQRWWQGPTTCSSAPIGNISADALLDQIMNAPLVRCDDIPWEMLGLSMAGWNGVLSLALAALWLTAYRRA